MDAATITALRPLLARVNAAGWYLYGQGHRAGGPWFYHWSRNHGTIHADEMRLRDGMITIEVADRGTWTVPALSVEQVTAVLELAGALPKAETPEDVYRTLARARAVRWGYDKTLDPADYQRLIEEYVADFNLRADVDVIWNAVRRTVA